MDRTSQRRERGFSMVELMVAMVVTLVVSGAIFGLLSAGGNAFRREPEVADRQQNIRVAMDAITRDIENAGSGMPLVAQVFTHTDTPLTPPAVTGSGAPYLNGAGPQGVMGAAGQALRGAAPTGTLADASDNSDVLEILIAESACPVYRVCSPAGLNGSAVTLLTREQIPAGGCLLSPANVGARGLVLLTDNRLFTIQPGTLDAAGTGCGAPLNVNGSFTVTAALPEWPTAGGAALTPAGGANALLYAARIVRYMIAPGLVPLDNSPSLWRSDTGRYDATGTASSRWKQVSGTDVKRGDLIAYLGDPDENGGSTKSPLEPHLHFGIRAGQRDDYPGKGEWRWMAGWIRLCPQDIGWLQPSLVITSQENPVGGYPQPDVPFWVRWGLELFITSLYSICGTGILVGAIRKKWRLFLIFPGFLLIAAGIVMHNNRMLSTYVLLVIGILVLTIGIFWHIRQLPACHADQRCL